MFPALYGSLDFINIYWTCTIFKIAVGFVGIARQIDNKIHSQCFHTAEPELH